MRFDSVVTALSLVTFAHAWPWPRADGLGGLLKRQNRMLLACPLLLFLQMLIDITEAAPAQTAVTAQATGAGNANANTAANAASVTRVGTSIQSLPSGSASKASGNDGNGTTVFDPRDPAGGISMITPNVMSGAQYYKVGDWIHFAWNYTSLQATPTAINVVATCSQNQATYTLASNQSVGDIGEIYWDTGAYQQSASVPLLTNQYTLVVWDADQAMTAAPRAGYLGAYQQFTFGMYTPQPYTPWSGKSRPCIHYKNSRC
jgi:hypothetical protein